MRTGRPKAELTLTAEERHTLEQWTRHQPKTAQALARRAWIVLACATGKPNQAVAAEFKTRGQTVGRWRRRFVERRWTVCSMNHAPAPRAAPAMQRWSGFWR